jgi:uncharacterized damage-inducible protein DinB
MHKITEMKLIMPGDDGQAGTKGRQRMKVTFEMMAGYNRWANSTLYDAVATLTDEERHRPLGAFFPTMMATLNHLLVADRIWMSRFTGSGSAPTALNEILHTDLADLRAARDMQDEVIIGFVESLDPERLQASFTYVPVTTPTPVTQRLAPALSHFFNHQTHHRGQCHMMLTALDKPSLVLDLIYYQRSDDGRKWA